MRRGSKPARRRRLTPAQLEKAIDPIGAPTLHPHERSQRAPRLGDHHRSGDPDRRVGPSRARAAPRRVSPGRRCHRATRRCADSRTRGCVGALGDRCRAAVVRDRARAVALRRVAPGARRAGDGRRPDGWHVGVGHGARHGDRRAAWADALLRGPGGDVVYRGGDQIVRRPWRAGYASRARGRVHPGVPGPVRRPAHVAVAAARAGRGVSACGHACWPASP